jgi:hypothetical protein
MKLIKHEDTIKTVILNIQGIDNNYMAKPFGHQIETIKQVRAFKENNKSTYFSIKRKALMPQLKDFIKQLKVTDLFCEYLDSGYAKDDCVQVFYKLAV